MVGISTMADVDMMDMPDYAAQMESFQRSDDARQKLLAVSLSALVHVLTAPSLITL